MNEFCSMLSSPRKVLLLGKRGSSIEKNISKVLPCLEVYDTDDIDMLGRRCVG